MTYVTKNFNSLDEALAILKALPPGSVGEVNIRLDAGIYQVELDADYEYVSQVFFEALESSEQV